MKIFIDADGCPVVDAAANIAAKHGIECLLICDTAHIFNRGDLKVITVEKGADSADFKLVNMISRGDIAVTQDYGLAAMCLAKNAVPINQNGLIFNSENIDSLLQSRYMSAKIRRSGGRLKGTKKRTSAQDEAFYAALESLIGGA